MKTMLNRTLSLLLVCALLLTSAPWAYAAEPEESGWVDAALAQIEAEIAAEEEPAMVSEEIPQEEPVPEEESVLPEEEPEEEPAPELQAEPYQLCIS